MAKKNSSEPATFIDINGKRYDAVSGQQITAVAPLISDVITPNGQQFAPAPLPQSKKPVVDIRPAHHLKPRRPEHAQTLMRTAVKRPSAHSKLKAHTPTDVLAKTPTQPRVSPKLSYYHTDPRREARASRTSQSTMVHRFAPGDVIQPHHVPATAGSPEPTLTVSSSAAHSHGSMDVFERALVKADAHLETPVNPKKAARLARKQAKRAVHKKPVHHRTTSVVAISVAVLLLAGFIAYQNKASLSVRYASAQAGFHASLPGYQPVGFGLGKVSYQAGKVSLAFHNGASDQTYTLSQQPSNWDSQTLFQNVVATNNSGYQTLQHQGQTIYVYGDNSAAWVNGGILYHLTTAGNLSTSQILDLASSL